MHKTLSFIAALLPVLVSAQVTKTLPADLRNAFAEAPEVYLDVRVEDVYDRALLLKMYPADMSPDDTMLLTINLTEIESNAFIELGLPYTLRAIDRRPELFSMSSDFHDAVQAWDQYPTYAAYEAMMYGFEQSHPSICKVYTLGTLASGRKILAARISDNAGIKEAEPGFMYSSSIHGDEISAYVFMLRLIDTLLTGYGIEQEISSLVNNTDIWIVPLANPDGTYYGGNNSVASARRRNANNVDLNRNFPDPEDGPNPDGNAWQPETMIFMGHADTVELAMSANFHGGAELMNYPWDTWARLAADNNWWILVSNEYADSCQYFSPSGYFDDFGTGVTNGYAWYTISGGRQDYMNYFRRCREVTIEITATKLLPSNQLPAYYYYNYRSFINYMKQVNYGLHGIVTDSLTGLPLKAKVFIQGFDLDSSHVWSSPGTGDYHRLLYAGTYTLTFSAEGYHSKSVPVTVANYQGTTLNIKLLPLGNAQHELESSKSEIIVFPNPCEERLTLKGIPDSGVARTCLIRDLQGRIIKTFDLVADECTLDVSGLCKGYYILDLDGAKTGFIKR